MFRLITALFLLSTELFFTKEPAAVFLTWLNDPCSSICINWVDKNPAPSSIQYRAQDSVQTSSLSEQIPFSRQWIIHKVYVHSLAPDTAYSFSLSNYPITWVFKTLPLTLTNPLVCVVGGDTHSINPKRCYAMNQAILNEKPSFIIIGGDLANIHYKNPKEEENFTRLLKFIRNYYASMRLPGNQLIPIIPVIGNHDTVGGKNQEPSKAEGFYKLFVHPRSTTYEVFHASNYLSLYILDSAHTQKISGKQARFLTAEMSKDFSTHRIVAYHMGAFPCYRDFKDSFAKSLREEFVSVFDIYRPHLVFEHHDHAYKRTYPILFGKKNPQGITYIGNSSWGGILRKPLRHAWYIKKKYYGRQFSKLILTKRKRKVLALTPDHGIIDSFTQKVSS